MNTSSMTNFNVGQKSVRGPDPKEDQLYDQIIAAIIAKRLRPGERLNESELAKAQDLSRTRIRRVLEKLEKEQIVQFKLNRGAFISRPSLKEAHETYEARIFIEEAVVRLACRLPSPRISQTMKKYLLHEEQAYQEKQGALCHISGEFHVMLAEIAANGVLLGFIKSLVQRCSVIVSLYEVPERDKCLLHEHRDIVEAIEAGNVEDAVAKMIHHMSHIQQAIQTHENTEDELDIYKEARRI